MGEYKLDSYPTDDALARAAASAWLDEIEAAARAETTYSVALSGGRIVKKFYLAVMTEGARRKTSFKHVRFFWSDERCVPPEDAESNYHLAVEFLFDPHDVKHDQVYRIRGEEPARAAREISEEICSVAFTNAAGQPVLDLVFLGMGEDGHVASLFPGEPEEVMSSPEVYRTVMAVKPPPQRVTLGYPAIAAAKQVWVLASGEGKGGALRESLRPGGKTPLARVLAARDQTRIFSDISL